MTLLITMKLYAALAVLFIVIPNAISSHGDEDVESLRILINEQNSLINRFSIKLQQMEAELDRINALEDELANQKVTNKQQNSVIGSLRAEIDELRKDHYVNSLLNSTTVHTNDAKHLDERHIGQAMIHTEVHAFKAKIEDEANLHKRLLLPDPTTSNLDIMPVAFSASLSKNEAQLTNHHTIIFDSVQTNYGNGYNKHSGSFIVPRAGVYAFTWTLLYHLTGEICTHLIVNGIEKANGYAYGGSAAWQTTTSIVVVQVEQGDTVLVQTVDYGGCDQAGKLLGDQWRKSSFSGWLIR